MKIFIKQLSIFYDLGGQYAPFSPNSMPATVFNYGITSQNMRFCCLYWYDVPSFIAQGNDACYGCSGSVLGTNVSSLLNQWNHVAISFDGNIVKCYVNGIQYFSSSKNFNTYLTTFSIGRSDPGHNSGEYFNGVIDELRIYNRALTAEEIKFLSQH